MNDFLEDENLVLIIKPDGSYEKVKGERITFDSNNIKAIYNFNNGVKIELHKGKDVFVEDAVYEDMVITFNASFNKI